MVAARTRKTRVATRGGGYPIEWGGSQSTQRLSRHQFNYLYNRCRGQSTTPLPLSDRSTPVDRRIPLCDYGNVVSQSGTRVLPKESTNNSTHTCTNANICVSVCWLVRLSACLSASQSSPSVRPSISLPFHLHCSSYPLLPLSSLLFPISTSPNSPPSSPCPTPLHLRQITGK